MRREHTSSSITPNVPFAEDCIFYAPLTEGDLTDHISGASPITQSNTLFQWDSNMQMYYLESNPGTTGYYVSPLYYDVNLPIRDFGNLTIVIDVINVEMGNQYCAHVLTPSWSDIGKNYVCAFMRQYGYGSPDNVLHRYVASSNFTSSSGSISFYKDGVLSHSVNKAEWVGSTSKPTYDKNSVAICMANDTSTFKVYAKNCRIYNRSMTAAEVAQL